MAQRLTRRGILKLAAGSAAAALLAACGGGGAATIAPTRTIRENNIPSLYLFRGPERCRPRRNPRARKWLPWWRRTIAEAVIVCGAVQARGTPALL